MEEIPMKIIPALQDTVVSLVSSVIIVHFRQPFHVDLEAGHQYQMITWVVKDIFGLVRWSHSLRDELSGCDRSHEQPERIRSVPKWKVSSFQV